MDSVAAPPDALNLRRLLRTTLRWRCPGCGRGALFEGGYRVTELCAMCGVRFERNDGAGSGAAWVAQMLGTALGFGAGGLLWLRWGSFPGIEWWLAGAACVGILATYRFCQAFWIWLLWATGMVYRDPDDLTRLREYRQLEQALRGGAPPRPPPPLRRVS
jgi:uncharacterized protein (DUF983 family)